MPPHASRGTSRAAAHGGPALAQEIEVVTVEAARSTTVGTSTYGVPIREIAIQSRVSHSDLDLTTTKGALELEDRIKKTAKSSCRQIDVDVPVPGSTEAKCASGWRRSVAKGGRSESAR